MTGHKETSAEKKERKEGTGEVIKSQQTLHGLPRCTYHVIVLRGTK